MRAVSLIRSLGPVDVLSVRRDSMARWLVVLAPLLALLYRFGAPVAAEWLDARLGFDLLPYYPLIMSSVGLISAALVGTVVGFLLLDQHDDGTLPALLVTPMSLADYLGYRLAVPTALAVVLSVVMFPLAGLTQLSLAQIVLCAICAAPLAAMYALFIGSFARNKVQGLALCKAAGMLTIPAIVAYFVPMPWQAGLAVVPHYWPMKVFWLFHESRPGAACLFAALGLAYQALLVRLLARRFARVSRR